MKKLSALSFFLYVNAFGLAVLSVKSIIDRSAPIQIWGCIVLSLAAGVIAYKINRSFHKRLLKDPRKARKRNVIWYVIILACALLNLLFVFTHRDSKAASVVPADYRALFTTEAQKKFMGAFIDTALTSYPIISDVYADSGSDGYKQYPIRVFKIKCDSSFNCRNNFSTMTTECPVDGQVYSTLIDNDIVKQRLRPMVAARSLNFRVYSDSLYTEVLNAEQAYYSFKGKSIDVLYNNLADPIIRITIENPSKTTYELATIKRNGCLYLVTASVYDNQKVLYKILNH